MTDKILCIYFCVLTFTIWMKIFILNSFVYSSYPSFNFLEICYDRDFKTREIGLNFIQRDYSNLIPHILLKWNPGISVTVAYCVCPLKKCQSWIRQCLSSRPQTRHFYALLGIRYLEPNKTSNAPYFPDFPSMPLLTTLLSKTHTVHYYSPYWKAIW